jgi:1-phosphofructokinase
MLPPLTGLDRMKVLTVTLNPALDRTLRVDRLVPGEHLLAHGSEVHAGGKGTNVSRALSAMGVRSTAMGILGLFFGDLYVALLEREDIVHDFTPYEGVTRISTTVIDERGETHIRERGGQVNGEVFDRFEGKLLERVDGSTLCVLSGSLPAGLAKDTYARLIGGISDRGGSCILDTSGDPLRAALLPEPPTGCPPRAIKPNVDEAGEVLDFLPRSEAGLRDACRRFHDAGVDLVVITRGRRGLFASGDGRVVSASVSVEGAVNTVGSGDASVAAMVIGRGCGFGLEETARLACAMGAANVLVSGAGILHGEDVEKIYDRVRLTAM